MSAKKIGSCILVLSLLLTQPAWANQDLATQVQNLATQMKIMQQNYETQINNLLVEVKELKKQQSVNIQQPQVQATTTPNDNKMFDVDYVGRHEGPFEKGGLIVSDSSGFGNVSLGGYADIELENFQDRHSNFDQHRFVLNVGAEIGERLRFYSEYEIEHGGPNASGGGEAKVEQAWIDFLINDAVNVRAGAVLVPFGRYNIYHDSDLNDLTDRPLVNRDIIPTTWTEAGAGFHGAFNPTFGDYKDLEVAYEIYMVNGLNEGFSDTGLRGARGSLGGDNNNNKAVTGRIVTSPAIGHEFGISGYAGDSNGNDDRILGIGVDFLTTWGALEVLGEWAMFRTDATSTGLDDVANHFQGGYIQANYHFWFDFLDDSFLGRTFDNPTFTFVNRLGYANIDDDFDNGTSLEKDNEEWRYTIGLNYRPVESWVLKLEYQINHSKLEALERGDNDGFIASIAMGF